MGERTEEVGGMRKSIVIGIAALSMLPMAAHAQGSRLEEYVDCAAYYGTMGEVSRASGERETATQYESSAGYAFESAMIGAQGNGQVIEALASRLNAAMEQMNAVVAGDLRNSATLVEQFDERCRQSMGSMPAR